VGQIKGDLAKTQIFDFYKMLTTLLEDNENIRFMTIGVDLFSVEVNKRSVISGFLRDVVDICALLGYYRA
jgi:hypothetical protein